jgi:heme A synthase
MMQPSLKAYHGRMRKFFACGLELLVYFQIRLGFWVTGGFDAAHVHCTCPRQTCSLKPLMSIRANA